MQNGKCKMQNGQDGDRIRARRANAKERKDIDGMKIQSIRTFAIWIFLLALMLLFFLACSRESHQDAKAYSKSLIALPGAEKVKYEKYGGMDQLSYELKMEYPANAAIQIISAELDKSGWTALMHDYLNPSIPSSHIRGWTDFIDGTKQPEQKVHRWIADWQSKSDDIVRYMLDYRYEEGKKEKLNKLIIVGIFIPASVAIEARERATNK